MMQTEQCKEDVTQVVGRDEFQSRTHQSRCTRDAVPGQLFCQRHLDLHARQLAKAKFQAAQRIARAERKARS